MLFYFYLFFCLCLPCPQAARFQIRLLRGSGFERCESIFREQIPERPFYSYCTNVVWLSKLPLVSAVLLNGPTWRTDETLDPDSQGFIAKTIAGSISVVYFTLWFLHLWFNEIVSGAAEILWGKVRWGEMIRYSGYPVILCLFESFWSKWNYRVQNGPCMWIKPGDFAYELQKYQESKFMFNPGCGCNLWMWASEAHCNGSIYN